MSKELNGEKLLQEKTCTGNDPCLRTDVLLLHIIHLDSLKKRVLPVKLAGLFWKRHIINIPDFGTFSPD